MSSQKHIQDELKSLESNLPFNNNMPFSVPEGYFEGLAATVLAKVKSSEASAEAELRELSPLLAGIPKVTPYSVPFFYFQENLDGVSKIDQEIESSILSHIGKELLYTVPQGYFTNLPEQILTRITEPKIKVVPLFARTWMRVASAAVVAGALFFAGFQYLNNKNENVVAGPGIKTETILADNRKTIEQEIKKASTKDLEEFIETVQINAAEATDKKIKISDKEEVEELLKDISTNEMESFLSAISTTDDGLLTND